jgi:hypothetical protein
MNAAARLLTFAAGMLMLSACSKTSEISFNAPPTPASKTPAPPMIVPTPTAPAFDITGLWLPSGASDVLPVAGDKPLLTPAGRRQFDANRTAAAHGDYRWDNTQRCEPPGMPRIMSFAEPIDISSDPHLIALAFQHQRLVRFVHLDDTYPAVTEASYMGESRGHWDAQALIVETSHFKTGPVLDSTGLPHGPKLVITERIERASDDTLIDHITIRDDDMYQRPWQAEVTLQRKPGLQFHEESCSASDPPRR